MGLKIAKITICLLISLLQEACEIFPGIPYKTYSDGERVELNVGALNSLKTQFPFSYYHLPVCGRGGNYTKVLEPNLGEILSGDILYSTGYEIHMNQTKFCQFLCSYRPKDEHENTAYKWMIDHEYTSTWFLDNLPAGRNLTYSRGEITDRTMYDAGIPLGEIDNRNGKNKYRIFNHLTFVIFINPDAKSKEKKFTVVEFNIIPWSINHSNSKTLLCAKTIHELMNNLVDDDFFYIEENQEIIYTYDVIFYYTSHQWKTRWDHYLISSQNDNIHFFSFINSTLVILIFSALLAHILCRALKRDIDSINTIAISEDIIDDSSWKQVSNDVFRKPTHSGTLCVFIGSGIQLFSMTVISLFFASIGFSSPEHRGTLLTMMLLLFVLMGFSSGYASSRFYKMFNESDWLFNALATAFFYPSIAFGIFFVINFFLTLEKSSGAVPFKAIFGLIVLWLCCSSPLVLIGAFIGSSKRALKNPGKVNILPSSIPPQPWYLELKFLSVLAGLFPFTAIFIELVYIMGSFWRHYFYTLFSFILVVVIIMLITSSEISMLVAYFQLSKGDYRWWWKSFFVSGSVSVYLLAYSLYYYITQLQMSRFSSLVLYFGYMLLLSFSVFLISGAIGLIATYHFLRKIYSMIKID